MTDTGRGVVYATAAYLFWGLSPLYWKLLATVPARQLLAHRVVWCALLLVLLMAARRRLGEVAAVFRAGGGAWTLLGTTALIAVNWYAYIWAVNHDQVLAASLGYYINPLVTVLLGMVFLHERLSRLQWVSLALAAVGVGVMVARVGVVPWLSLLLAVTFAFYGLLRKRVAAGPQAGLLVETALLTPLALSYLVVLGVRGEGAFGGGVPGLGAGATALLLAAAGAVTALPLVWFTYGARRLPLSTVGLLQYLAPSSQFLLAVLLYREPFAAGHLAAFVCIWAALAIFTVDARRRYRRMRPLALG